ncbi:hypothetical protein [Agrobacterium rosae]|uniref:Uncharacterized protein n=1 Tax=Agrobacterium rosae TaxID=1972867 RepID=A0AAE5RT49_9HYPH|nr:hypothetical protein [Agrobacterium rosae]KAA3509197.1 hypothetical protein DXM21_22515 [Agrobacterium rosae]KAA3513891.1 hypothetical protein DXM25_22705 [Agrobacterium rosae]MQB50910.1 hypothetical protein [Agrobacterium rosae]POO48875.1 hypothetical protein CPJ18_23145 [Agrobacterium rosae]
MDEDREFDLQGAVEEDPYERVDIAAGAFPGVRSIAWPIAGNPGGFVSFDDYWEWRTMFLSFSLHKAVPRIVTAKFNRALKLHLLAWIDADLFKAGELVGWTALESALTEVYKGSILSKRRSEAALAGSAFSEKVTLAQMLKYMVMDDGLTDGQISLVLRTGGSIVDRLIGRQQPALNRLRNDLAHG